MNRIYAKPVAPVATSGMVRAMRPTRLLALALAAVALAVAPGCKGRCRALSEKLCECAINSVEKDACLRAVSAREGSAVPSVEDEATCASLLPGCDCHTVDPAAGKKACGLAR